MEKKLRGTNESLWKIGQQLTLHIGQTLQKYGSHGLDLYLLNEVSFTLKGEKVRMPCTSLSGGCIYGPNICLGGKATEGIL